MAIDLEVRGPFFVPYTLSAKRIKQIDSKEAKAFWELDGPKAVATKQGVYVFALKAAHGYRSVYIGKAGRNFKQEIFQPHKLKTYAHEFSEGAPGTPCFFFVCPKGNNNKVPADTCKEIETFLIQLAVQKNPRLRNDRHTTLAAWSSAGLIRSNGRPSATACSFSKLIGM